jgi:hypothetical protein
MIGALLPLVLELLPSLAGAIAGGKGNAVAETAAKVARSVFGTDDPAKVAEAIKSPERLEAFKAKLDAETAQFQATMADVQDARAQTIALTQAGSSIAWGAPVISVLIVAGFLALVAGMMFKSVPDSQVALVLFGSLSTAFGSVVSYWLGSSAPRVRMRPFGP